MSDELRSSLIVPIYRKMTNGREHNIYHLEYPSGVIHKVGLSDDVAEHCANRCGSKIIQKDDF